MSVRASVLEEQKKMKKAAAGATATTQQASDSAPPPASDAPVSFATIDRVNRDAAAAKFPSLLLQIDYMQRLNFPGMGSAQASQPDGHAWASAAVKCAGESKHLCECVAIDCEMVITSGGSQELARLTAVDARGSVLLDMLVVPEAPVVNYNTQFSGITKELLKGAWLVVIGGFENSGMTCFCFIGISIIIIITTTITIIITATNTTSIYITSTIITTSLILQAATTALPTPTQHYSNS